VSIARFASMGLCLAVSVLSGPVALAQTCVGAASFVSGPARLGAGIDVTDDAKQYGAQIAFGRAAGPFIAGSIGRVEVEGTDETATSFAAEGGYSLLLAGRGSLELCPIAGVGYASAEIDVDAFSVDLSTRAISAGFSIGGVAASNPTVTMVPSVGLSYVRQNLKSEGTIEFDEWDDFGLITVASGFIFARRVTLRPYVALPVGLDDSDPTYGVGVSFNFGTPPTTRREE
jgi:hypothetical protein